MENRDGLCGANFIDKTEALERGIKAFPSIYIEGAAACGKTTAVRMLAEKHPEVEVRLLDPDKLRGNVPKAGGTTAGGNASKVSGRFAGGSARGKRPELGTVWYVLDPVSPDLDEKQIRRICEWIREMNADSRVILTGREKPPGAFLDLVWKRRMQLIPQRELCLSEAEVTELVHSAGSRLNPRELFRETGGYAGCVDMLLRLAERSTEELARLKSSWEIAEYIQTFLLDTLPGDEREIMRRMTLCPWISGELCREIWGIPWAETALENLERKGLLVFDEERKQWRAASVLTGIRDYTERKLRGEAGLLKHLGVWYDGHGYTREALRCLRDSSDQETYRECVLRHYADAPWLEVPLAEVRKWKGDEPELCYLRGVCCYREQDGDGLAAELGKLSVSREDDFRKREIYLNLAFLKTDISLEEWMGLLEEYCGEKEGMRIYHMLGNSYTYLCGLRDMSALFACEKQTERALARVWKDRLTQEDWRNYQLARIDYYLETERQEHLQREDAEWLARPEGSGEQRLAKLYLLCKMQSLSWKEERPEDDSEKIRKLEKSIRRDGDDVCGRIADAVSSLYAPWRKDQGRLLGWMRAEDEKGKTEIDEKNYAVLCCLAKGYLYLNQYEKAGSLLNRLLPYMQAYRRRKFQAELMFQNAIVKQIRGLHGQALRSVIESFVVTGDRRYVRFYAEYGKRGHEVLENYVEWLRKNTPGGWHRKKQYQYGNVLRMKQEDYMGVVLRSAKKGAKAVLFSGNEEPRERLTMMEAVILRDISQGLSNAEICESLNLKLPTVKSHIYNLYKKLDVNSRVQAVNRAKEMGLI